MTLISKFFKALIKSQEIASMSRVAQELYNMGYMEDYKIAMKRLNEMKNTKA